jgi:hypothetical protein
MKIVKYKIVVANIQLPGQISDTIANNIFFYKNACQELGRYLENYITVNRHGSRLDYHTSVDGKAKLNGWYVGSGLYTTSSPPQILLTTAEINLGVNMKNIFNKLYSVQSYLNDLVDGDVTRLIAHVPYGLETEKIKAISERISIDPFDITEEELDWIHNLINHTR